MRVTSYRAGCAVVAIGLLLIAHGVAAESRTPRDGGADGATGAQEPAVLKAVIAARWRLASIRAALPPVQGVHNEAVEIQDFIQYAFDGGALRLCVSPGPKGGNIFAVLVDAREPRYANFAQLASTERYGTFRHGAYVAVVPVGPVSRDLFNNLKSKLWTEKELQQRLGAPSYHWHVHGVGYSGLTYVPEGLSFIGDIPRPGTAVRFQILTDEGGHELPPLASVAHADYAKLQHDVREGFANEFLRQREQIDLALAGGKPSPDGRFIVGPVNLVELANTEEVVIREGRKPERRYPVPYFTSDKDYLWLNARTILFRVDMFEQEFYTIDAPTGAMKLAVNVPYDPTLLDDPHRIIDFGVSGPDQFWYKTADEERHEVTVQGLTPQH